MSNSFKNELERLVKASKEGDFSFTFNDKGLSPEEAETVRTLNDVIRNFHSAFEYELMKYRLTSNALGIALWDMDVIEDDPVNPANKFKWSKELRNMLGFSTNEDFPDLLNSWSDKLHPDDKERALKAFATHISDRSGKTPYDIEYRLMLKNGQYRTFHAFGTTLRDSEGAPIRVAGALEDIEEKVQMREALEKREKMMRVLNEAAIVFLSHKDKSFEDMMTEGINLIAEAADLDRMSVWRNYMKPGGLHMSQIYRWEKKSGGTTAPMETLLDVPYADLVPDWETLFIKDMVINGPVSRMPEREAASMKRFGIMSAFAVPIFINNSFWGYVLFEDHRNERYFDDNSADMMHSAAFLCANTVMRTEMEREIKQTNQLNQFVLEAMPVGLTVFDENFKFIDCNEAVLKMYNVTREFYSTFFGSEKHSPEYQPDGSKSHEKALKVINQIMNGEDMRIEWIHLLPGGELLPVELTMTRMKQGDKYIGLGYIYDMREPIRLNKEIEAALIKAQEASRTKSAFLANMSHEIRTPMNAILGITELQLQNETLTAGTEEALLKIYDSGNLLMGIINDILDLSKIEAGKLEIIPVNYDIPSLINDAVQLNLLRYESKPIEFTLDVDENTPLHLYGDELRIKQIINNILSNAYKYTERGTVILSVFALIDPSACEINPDNEEDSSTTIIFRVSDTGQGMTEEQVNVLFDEYTRFNMEANRTTVGTGLGMSITKRLVDLMNGDIFVESEAGKGSVFTVRLPQIRVSAAVCGKELTEKLRNFNFKSTSMTKKAQILREYMPYGSVLVVDDVESNIYVTKGMLLPYGLNVDTASSGFEAIDKIKDGNDYDIIFMDHMMPRMDGIEAARIIRRMGFSNYIVALTANAIVGQAGMFMEKGFDGYISKPIDSRELNAVLNDFIRNKKPLDALLAAQTLDAQRKEHEISKDMVKKIELEKFFLIDAKNAIRALGDICAKIQQKDTVVEDEDLETYTITIHGMKSALANVGETELSAFSYKLEQICLERDFSAMLKETPVFINALKTIIEKLSRIEEAYYNISDEDIAYLKEKLQQIKEACMVFHSNNARLALDELMLKKWPRQISEIIDEISVNLLHSAFKKAASIAEKALDFILNISTP